MFTCPLNLIFLSYSWLGEAERRLLESRKYITVTMSSVCIFVKPPLHVNMLSCPPHVIYMTSEYYLYSILRLMQDISRHPMDACFLQMFCYPVWTLEPHQCGSRS